MMTGSQPCVWVRTACDNPSSTIRRNPNRCPICASRSAILWQNIINKIAIELKSLPGGPDRDFYKEGNAQFGFLKDAYRNHAQHAHDDPYDMEKALSILDHVRAFMQQLEKGGLSE